MKLSIANTPQSLTIKIDGLVHLKINSKIIGYQSWIMEGRKETWYCIEFYTRHRKIKTEYKDRRLWESILKQLDK